MTARAAGSSRLGRFPIGIAYGVDREVHTTAGQEAGATRSCSDRQPRATQEIHGLPMVFGGDAGGNWIAKRSGQIARSKKSICRPGRIGDMVKFILRQQAWGILFNPTVRYPPLSIPVLLNRYTLAFPLRRGRSVYPFFPWKLLKGEDL